MLSITYNNIMYTILCSYILYMLYILYTVENEIENRLHMTSCMNIILTPFIFMYIVDMTWHSDIVIIVTNDRVIFKWYTLSLSLMGYALSRNMHTYVVHIVIMYISDIIDIIVYINRTTDDQLVTHWNASLCLTYLLTYFSIISNVCSHNHVNK